MGGHGGGRTLLGVDEGEPPLEGAEVEVEHGEEHQARPHDRVDHQLWGGGTGEWGMGGRGHETVTSPPAPPFACPVNVRHARTSVGTVSGSPSFGFRILESLDGCTKSKSADLQWIMSGQWNSSDARGGGGTTGGLRSGARDGERGKRLGGEGARGIGGGEEGTDPLVVDVEPDALRAVERRREGRRYRRHIVTPTPLPAPLTVRRD